MAPMLDNALIKRLGSKNGNAGSKKIDNVPKSARSSMPPLTARDVKLEDVPERPMDPERVLRMQAAARGRSTDLQNIFTSRHSTRTDGLRERLESLNVEASGLRSRIASLERELQEATRERLKDMRMNESDEPVRQGSKRHLNVASEVHTAPPLPGLEGHAGKRKTSGISNLTQGTNDSSKAFDDTHSVEAAEPGMLNSGDDIAKADNTMLNSTMSGEASVVIPESSGGDCSLHGEHSTSLTDTPQMDISKRHSDPHDKRYQDEVLMPLLVRRRAEARFKEASYVHENAIAQMKAELQEIERRSAKQQNWMKQVDAHVLKVELMKASYEVRLDAARKRVDALGCDLSKAYDNMDVLLQERLVSVDLSAKNDALVWYLHLLGVSDKDNHHHFIDNKKELSFLNERSSRLREKRSQLDDLLEKVQGTQLLSQDIVKHSEDLDELSEQLRKLWDLVPTEWKDSVYKSVQKGLAPQLTKHPTHAIQELKSTSSHVTTAMNAYLRAVSEFVDGAHAFTSRRRNYRSSPSKSSADRKPPVDALCVTDHLSDKASEAYIEAKSRYS